MYQNSKDAEGKVVCSVYLNSKDAEGKLKGAMLCVPKQLGALKTECRGWIKILKKVEVWVCWSQNQDPKLKPQVLFKFCSVDEQTCTCVQSNTEMKVTGSVKNKTTAKRKQIWMHKD